MIKVLLLFHLFAFSNPETFRQTSSQTTSTATLKSVTVYQLGAELEHTSNAQLTAGNHELIIDGISSNSEINSIRVNCSSAVTILGVEFNNNYLGEENISPEVKKLKDSAEFLNTKVYELNILINTHTELLEVLKMNRDIRGSQTGLSVSELSRLLDYYKNKSITVQTEIMNLNKEKKIVQHQINKLNAQIEEEQKKNTKKGGRIILQLNVASSGKYDFKINYFTHQAHWTPYYDIKCNSINDPLEITYKAKIFQTTGIDWKKVNLSLSTATPQIQGTAPLLKTWFLGYINPLTVMNKNIAKSNSLDQIFQGRTPGLNVIGADGNPGEATSVIIRGTGTITTDNEPLYIIDGIPVEPGIFQHLNPNSFKSVDVLKDASATALYGSRARAGVIVITTKSGLNDYISVSESTLEVSYDIDIPYDVPTNGKAQIATLKTENVNTVYKHYAVPKLSKDVYLLAEVPNWETLNFIPGEANIIFEGTFIGQSFIDPAVEKDTLNLTLGIDKRVVIKKELVKDFSTVKFVGSNKTQSITYDISVRNNKNDAINILIKDPFPVSTQKEIVVNLEEYSKGSINEEIGVVTWQLQIPKGTSEKKRISYSIKYPKNKKINL